MESLTNVLTNSQERIQKRTDISPIRIEEYKCEICSLILPRLHSLRVHLRDVHRENAFPCETCGEKLASRSLLKFHMKSHRMAEVIEGNSGVRQPKDPYRTVTLKTQPVKRKFSEVLSSADLPQNHQDDTFVNKSNIRNDQQRILENSVLQRLEVDDINRPSVLRYSEAESSAIDIHNDDLLMVFKQERIDDDDVLCDVSGNVPSTSETETGESNDNVISFQSSSETGRMQDRVQTEMIEVVKVEIPKMELSDENGPLISFPELRTKESEVEYDENGETSHQMEIEGTGHNHLKCSFCQKTFPNEISLVTHESMHDIFKESFLTDDQTDNSGIGDDHDDPPTDNKNNDYLSNLQGSGEFTCNKCPQSFPRQHLLKVHTYKVHGENAFVCLICGEKCPTRRSLTKHKQVHVVDGAFKCETCGFSQLKYSNFLRHLKLHSGTKDYTCEWCGKSFTTSTVLIRHRRRHTGEKPYSCEECGERFARLYGLKVHKSKHTGRKYNCTEENCSKAFYSKSSLNNHLKSHLPERPYKCVACGCGFYMSSHYKDHLRKHTGEKPFVCDICGRAYSRKAELVIHHRMHTGERPFICTQCDKSFIQKSSLRLHSLTHSRNKEHKCGECDRTFKHKGALKRHLKCAHRKDDSDLSCDSLSLYLSDDTEEEENSSENLVDVADNPKSESND